MRDLLTDFEDHVVIKDNPELRHVFAHILFAIEALAKNCPTGAMDNVKSVEGLVLFEGDDPVDWESYYQARAKGGDANGLHGQEGKEEGQEVQGPVNGGGGSWFSRLAAMHRRALRWW